MSGKAEVEAAVATGEKAFESWRGLTAKSRAAIMFRFHALLEKHADELVRMMATKGLEAYSGVCVLW